ncbi:MAG: bifunctional nuclease family protein, partial [Atopobium sp.]|nr:bifunctional nuclease family protein [Atopobium sp.]
DIKSVRIVGVRGTMFFSQIELISKEGEHIYVDARPSDAIALAVRTNAPIFADESVLEIAAAPDFTDVEKDVQAQELEEFHQFIEDVSPEDFS